MKATRRTSVRRLPSGSYIVAGVGSRSAVTGRFIAPPPEPPPEGADGDNEAVRAAALSDPDKEAP